MGKVLRYVSLNMNKYGNHWCSLANRTLVKVILVLPSFVLALSLAANSLCLVKCQQETMDCPSPPVVPPVPVTKQLGEAIRTHFPYARNPAFQDCFLSLLVGCSFYFVKMMFVALLRNLPKLRMSYYQNMSKKGLCEDSCVSSAENESVNSTDQVVLMDTLCKKKHGLESRLKMEAKLYSLQERLCELLENTKLNGKQNYTTESVRQPLVTSRKVMMRLAKRLSAIDKEIEEL